jgi:small subunit ribosomal protein S18
MAGVTPARPREYRPEKLRRFVVKPKVCAFCTEKIVVDYKDISRLRRYISDRGKIEPRRRTGACARHQRRIALAVKRLRFLALFPDASSHIVPKEVRTIEPKVNGEVKDAQTDVPTQEKSSNT